MPTPTLCYYYKKSNRPNYLCAINDRPYVYKAHDAGAGKVIMKPWTRQSYPNDYLYVPANSSYREICENSVLPPDSAKISVNDPNWQHLFSCDSW